MSINLLSFIFLPGIVVHEMSHFLMAIILFVPVGNMEFVPKRHGNNVRMGSVEIGKTDPIRRSLIGFAPIFIGLIIITTVVSFFSSNVPFIQGKGLLVYIALILVIAYLLFAIGNTMFSSSKDMDGTAEILIVLFIIFIGAYVLGFRPQLSILDKIFTIGMIAVIQRSSMFLLAPIAVDLLLLGIIKPIIDRH
jgi:hypothetical protein